MGPLLEVSLNNRGGRRETISRWVAGMNFVAELATIREVGSSITDTPLTGIPEGFILARKFRKIEPSACRNIGQIFFTAGEKNTIVV